MTIINYINASLEIWGCVMSAVVAICLFVSKSRYEKGTRLYFQMLACNTGALLFDVLALYFRGDVGALHWWGVRLSNFLAFTSNYLLLATFVHYLTVFLNQRTKVSVIPLVISRVICGASILLIVATQFYPIVYTIDAQNMYHRAKMFWLSQATGIVCMVACIWLLIHYRSVLVRQEKMAFWTYIVLPVVALFVQIFVYGIVLLNLVNTVSLIVIFLFFQAEQGQRMAEQENLLTQSRISIMLSQIQPHFLYNALNVIQYLCETQPKQAALAIDKFSKYLRANMDSLTQTHPVPLEQDLDHLKNYLAIEKLRFPDIEIRYDLQCVDFCVPALTLQPLVENAIKHGIRQLEQGGIIHISSWADEVAWYLSVEDNGGGFDTKATLSKDGRTHLGLENTRSRLRALCNATLIVESAPGEGAKMTITIPKEKAPCESLQ